MHPTLDVVTEEHSYVARPNKEQLQDEERVSDKLVELELESDLIVDEKSLNRLVHDDSIELEYEIEQNPNDDYINALLTLKHPSNTLYRDIKSIPLFLNKISCEKTKPTPTISSPSSDCQEMINNQPEPKEDLHKCPECGYLFTNEPALWSHIEKHAKKPRLKHKCDHCTYESHIKSNVKIHFDIAHKELEPQTVNTDLRLRETLTFECGTCNKTFSTQSSYEYHMKLHTKSYFVCSVCRYQTPYRANFNKHCKRHTGERPFQCELCSKRFLRSTHLRRHQYSHYDLKTFSCDICDKEFSMESCLYIHMKRHDSSDPI